LNSAGTSHQNRSLGGEQLDHSIVDTLVSALFFQALPEARKRESVPTATAFPCPSDLKTDLFEKALNALVSELITILGVNGFPWHEVLSF
jgi:hypothetical protein